MIPRACRRLAEVDFPIAEVSRHAAREKSIRHGHPSTLHLWWARRPLASSRAVLLALLLPDPCDPHCPADFKRQARGILNAVRQPPASDAELRAALLWFAGAFANWDLAAHSTYLRVGRELVRAAHGDEAPLVVDPFAGGGSIPLEALRLGCEAFASDLNPVACLILKVMLQDIPRRGPGLADDLRRAGGEVRAAAARELAGLYPADADGATPIAYLWARTVRCEAPDCGAELPLLRSFWLCRKRKRKRALRHRVERRGDGPPVVAFEVFTPAADGEVRDGTVARARAACLCCGAVLAPERVRTQLAAQRGGADAVFDRDGRRTGGARLTAVVTLRPGEPGRHYRLPTEADYAAVRRAQERLAGLLGEWERGGRAGLCPVPDEPLPPIGTLGFRVQRYGMMQWADLFTARQKVAMQSLANQCHSVAAHDWLARCLALVFSGVVDRNVALATWRPQADQEKVEHLFARQALPMAWDFAEAVPLTESTGSLSDRINILVKTVSAMANVESAAAQTQSADATDHPLPDQSAAVWFTDPPYYDAIPYSDLSDFFLVWLKRSLPSHPLLRDPFDAANPLSPKDREAVQDETKRQDGNPKDRQWFEATMARAFADGRRVLAGHGVGSVVFAHKTTEGWEALLAGMIRGGWTITGSWPIATELGTRLRARESAALATSIHLTCRPRPADAPIGDWAECLRELPLRVADWMARLQGEGIRGADLVFACIGPALEIYSRSRAVETADGRAVPLSEYLERVWEVVGRAALETVLGAAEARARNGMTGALEEDARLTALFLWTLQTTDAGGDDVPATDDEDEAAAAPRLDLPFDVVRRFAQPMGIDLDRWTGRIVAQVKGVVRLLPVADRAADLFGDAGAGAAAEWIEADPAGGLQRSLFPEWDGARPAGGRRRRKAGILDGEAELQALDATTLDRVHAAMLLQANGHAVALRALLKAERERGPGFLRLANALTALYPRASREKRLLDAMLLAVPR